MYWAAGSPCYSGVSYYYMASRDLVDSSTAGAHVASVPTGFPATAAALQTYGLTWADVRYRIGLTSMGADAEGSDWTYDPATAIEERRYSGMVITLVVANEPAVKTQPMLLTVTLHYGDLQNCYDDGISGMTDQVKLVDVSAGSSPAAQAVAAAMLTDLGSFGVFMHFDSMQPIGQGSFNSNGRAGAIFEANPVVIEIGDAVLGICM